MRVKQWPGIRAVSITLKVFVLGIAVCLQACTYLPIDSAWEARYFTEQTGLTPERVYRCRYIFAKNGSSSGGVGEGVMFITEKSLYKKAAAGDRVPSGGKPFEFKKENVRGVSMNSGGIYPQQLQIELDDDTYAFMIVNDSGTGFQPDKLAEVHALLELKGYPPANSRGVITIQSSGTPMIIAVPKK